MKIAWCIRVLVLIMVGASLALASGVIHALAGESRDDFERRIVAEVEKRNPVAAELFVRANEARAKNNHREAADLYGRVYEKAPWFVHALRRQCWELAQLGDRAGALPLCREAVKKEPSAENLATLSLIILSIPKGNALSQPESTEALELASRAVELKPDDPFTYVVLSRAAINADSLPALRRAIDGLDRLALDVTDTQIAKFILALSEGRYENAERALSKARQLGISESDYQSGMDLIRNAKPLPYRLIPVVALGGGVWLGGFVFLLLFGWLLSQIALRAAARISARPEGEVRGIDIALRKAYKGVLWLCCVYYYVSLPLVFLMVAVVGGGLLYVFFVAGHIPVKLALLVVVLTFVTLAAIAKSIFVRSRDEDPGSRLKLQDHPRLANLLDEVAGEVRTPHVDSVYMTPGTDIAVMERGGIWRQLARQKERCLILGAGVLKGMRIGPFRAILAHEYGHLSNRDTAGGEFALAVRRSLITMAQNIAASGAAAWYNPAWLFLIGFERIFLRISQGASRLQEVLADRWAAAIYGARAFEEGLRHVITQSVRFDAHATATLEEILNTKAPLTNLYAYQPVTPSAEEQINQAVRAALDRPPSAYDSHPSPTDRFTFVRALPSLGTRSSADDDDEAWSLFNDRAAIELEMTDAVRKNVRAQSGVEIPTAPVGNPANTLSDSEAENR